MTFDEWWQDYQGIKLPDQLGRKYEVARDAWLAAINYAHKRYRAVFTPQAWINDNVTEVDPEGPAEWDCTMFVMKRFKKLTFLDEEIMKQGYFSDSNDVLKEDQSAPQWIQRWQGPFSIVVYDNPE